MAIGEVGKVTTGVSARSDYITITLTEPLDNPVIVLSSTQNASPFSLRVIDTTVDANGLTTSFRIALEEWEYLDGPHGTAETITWMALEEGTHTMPDGRTVEAGFAQARQTSPLTSDTVNFTSNFTTAPVVITTVLSNEDPNTFETVDSDPLGITSSGFKLRLQEEEGGDRIHPYETVGWVAIEPGGNGTSGTAKTVSGVDENVDTVGLGATYTNSVVLVDTQTIAGGDTATENFTNLTSSTVGLFLNEETSGDAETDHTNEVFGVVTFEAGLILACFTKGTKIDTLLGACKIEDLKPGSMVKVRAPNGGSDYEYAELKRMYSRRFSIEDLRAHPNLRPVRIKAGALGNGLPENDLVVSRQHRMLVNSSAVHNMFNVQEVLVSAIRLTKMPQIFVDRAVNEVEYFHLLFDDHQVVFAEGAPSESLYAGAQVLDGMQEKVREEIFAIFPELTHENFTPEPACMIPPPERQKSLVQRIKKNGHAVVEMA